jgi:hypothetical protein
MGLGATEVNFFSETQGSSHRVKSIMHSLSCGADQLFNHYASAAAARGVESLYLCAGFYMLCFSHDEWMCMWIN